MVYCLKADEKSTLEDQNNASETKETCWRVASTQYYVRKAKKDLRAQQQLCQKLEGQHESAQKVRKLQRRSQTIESLMVECWTVEETILEYSINDDQMFES